MVRPFRIVLTLAFAFAALSFSGGEAQAQSTADAKRVIKLGKEIWKEDGLKEVDIKSMRGKSGVMIMLTGNVPNEEASKKAEAIAADFRGVKEVRNRLRVSEPETFKDTDEQIMAKIEKAIEDDDELSRARRKLDIAVKDRKVTVKGKLKDWSQAGSLINEIRRIPAVATLNYDKLKY